MVYWKASLLRLQNIQQCQPQNNNFWTGFKASFHTLKRNIVTKKTKQWNPIKLKLVPRFHHSTSGHGLYSTECTQCLMYNICSNKLISSLGVHNSITAFFKLIYRLCECISQKEQVAQLSPRDSAAAWVSCGANINVVLHIQRTLL